MKSGSQSSGFIAPFVFIDAAEPSAQQPLGRASVTTQKRFYMCQ